MEASRRLSCGPIQVAMAALGKVQDERGSVVPTFEYFELEN